jgi:hypothetical protein
MGDLATVNLSVRRSSRIDRMNDLWVFLKSDGGRVTLAILAIVVSAAIAITLYLLNRKRKSLVYEALSMTRILTVREKLAGRIRILFDDKEVQDVGLLKVRFTNAGTEPVDASDFIRPISFSISEGARFIEASVVVTTPEGLDASLDAAENKVSVIPTLWNSQDSITLKCLIANFDGRVSFDGRIRGANLEPRRHLGGLWRALLETAFVFLLGGILTFARLRLSSEWLIAFLFILVGVAGGLIGSRVFKHESFPNDYK